MKRLRKLGFLPSGGPGGSSRYRSNDGTLVVDLSGQSQPFKLSGEHLALVPDSSDPGSVYVHRVKETEPPELRREAVLVANGPYQRFFLEVAPPSGRGSTGDVLAWRDVALVRLLSELERRWSEAPKE